MGPFQRMLQVVEAEAELFLIAIPLVMLNMRPFSEWLAELSKEAVQELSLHIYLPEIILDLLSLTSPTFPSTFDGLVLFSSLFFWLAAAEAPHHTSAFFAVSPPAFHHLSL